MPAVFAEMRRPDINKKFDTQLFQLFSIRFQIRRLKDLWTLTFELYE